MRAFYYLHKGPKKRNILLLHILNNLDPFDRFVLTSPSFVNHQNKIILSRHIFTHQLKSSNVQVSPITPSVQFTKLTNAHKSPRFTKHIIKYDAFNKFTKCM